LRGVSARLRRARAGQRRGPGPQRRRSQRRRLVALAAAAAAAAVVALILLGDALRDGSGGLQHTAPAEGFTLGSADAPVLITAWEDFQCPACRAANVSALRQIEADYVNTGKARIQFRQFPFLGAESVSAAEASQCAADQHRFWDYHDALFDAQRGENSGAFAKTKLKQIAADLGLDTVAFDACFDEGQHKDSVQAEKEEGVKLGVNATPTFFVNGRRVADWRDYAAFRSLIEDALAGAKAGN